MNDAVELLRLKDAWRECERNAYYLCQALVLLDLIMPLTSERFEQLTDEQIRELDQFVLRFAKLQDAMGNHLLPSLLSFFQEPYEDRPMLDKLNRLEKLGYFCDVEKWQESRKTRNKFTHDYPDDPEKNAAQLNLASESAAWLYSILIKIENKFQQAYPDIELGKTITQNLPIAWAELLPSTEHQKY